MIDYCEAMASGAVLDPRASKRRVIGVDIDIRAHNARHRGPSYGAEDSRCFRAHR